MDWEEAGFMDTDQYGDVDTVDAVMWLYLRRNPMNVRLFLISLLMLCFMGVTAYAAAPTVSTCYHKGCIKNTCPGSIYCREHTCFVPGCVNETEAGSDRCILHTAEGLKELCILRDCTQKRAVDSRLYCKSHSCARTGCDVIVKCSGKYCKRHSCIEGECILPVTKYGDRCGYYHGKINAYNTGRTTTFGASPTKKKSSGSNNKKASTKKRTVTRSSNGVKKSSKATEMPDCDDYETLDDFLDDWDGYIPGGIDAEDYWEDW